MSISSSISILVGEPQANAKAQEKTVVLNLQSDSGPLTTITYTHSNQMVNLNVRDKIVLSRSEINVYFEQLNNFSVTIRNNFSDLNYRSNAQWTLLDWSMGYNEKQDELSYTLKKNNISVIEMSANNKSREITIKKRPQSVSLYYAEWQMFMYFFDLFKSKLKF